jgi:RNA polymerase sigma-70 factor (ECF subfamily)
MFDEQRLNRLYRYGLALTNNESLSYDLLQDALESLLKLPERRKPENGDAWLRTCMRNRYVDQLRHDKRFPSDSIDDMETQEPLSMTWPDPAELLINQNQVQQILDQLQPQERELLYLWACEEYTAQEIADLQSAPRGTILSRIHRLRARIARLTAPDTEAEGGGRP